MRILVISDTHRKDENVERILKKEFKNCLDKNGIKIPYPQIEVHND